VALRQTEKPLAAGAVAASKSTSECLELPSRDPISADKSYLTNAFLEHRPLLTRRKMMNLVRFEPWSIADLMQREFGRLPVSRFVRDNAATSVADWAPAVDIIEETDRFVLRADVPGVAVEQIDVSMEDGVLTVSGERSVEQLEDTTGARHFERQSGRFHRRFSLPDSVDAEAIAAKCSNGILEVIIPKLPEVQPRRITVEAA
jgi:HSP20 family protein